MQNVRAAIRRGLDFIAGRQILIFPVLVLLILVLPRFMAGYQLGVMINIAINIIVVIGLCLLTGYAGQVSLGHAAFYGLGAYGSGILTATYGLSPWLALVLAAVVTGIVAWIIGVPILKLEENYLALGTLGFGIIVFIIFQEAISLTGGPSGLSGIPNISLGDFVFRRDSQFYYLAWGFAILAIFLAYNIVDSRLGRALRAIHSSEVAAGSMGIDTAKLKVQIFVLSAVYASVAGSLYAHWVNFINPAPFSFSTSISFVVMAAVGGLASIWGPIAGVSAVVILVEALRDIVPRFMGHAGGEYEAILFGLILVLVMVFAPGGLTTSLGRLLQDRLPNEQLSGEKVSVLGKQTPGETKGAGK